MVEEQIDAIRETNWRGKPQYRLGLVIDQIGSTAFDAGVYLGNGLRDEDHLIAQILGDNIMDIVASISSDSREFLAEIPREYMISSTVYGRQTLKELGVDVDDKNSLERAAKKLISDEAMRLIAVDACVTGVALSIGIEGFTETYDNASYQGDVEHPSSELLRDRTAVRLRSVLDWSNSSGLFQDEMQVVLSTYPKDWREDAIWLKCISTRKTAYELARSSPDLIPYVALKVASNEAAGSGVREYIKSTPFLYELYVDNDATQAERLILVWSMFILALTHPEQVNGFGKLASDTVFPNSGEMIASNVLSQLEAVSQPDTDSAPLFFLFHWLTVHALQPSLVDVRTMQVDPGTEEFFDTQFSRGYHLSKIAIIVGRLCAILEGGVESVEKYLNQDN